MYQLLKRPISIIVVISYFELITDIKVEALDTTTEEIFATNHLKESADLLSRINRNLAEIWNNPEKLEIIYNLTKSLNRK